MIIWRGWGIIAPVIVFVVAFVTNITVDHYAGNGYWKANDWPLGSAFIIAGLFLLFAHILLKRPPQTLIDEATGERVKLVAKNDFFFLPLAVWALASVGLGLWITIMGKF